MSKEIEIERLLRLPQVLELVPVGKSHWWAGCANGRYPKPLKLSPGITVWRSTDIQALIQDLSMEDVA